MGQEFPDESMNTIIAIVAFSLMAIVVGGSFFIVIINSAHRWRREKRFTTAVVKFNRELILIKLDEKDKINYLQSGSDLFESFREKDFLGKQLNELPFLSDIFFKTEFGAEKAQDASVALADKKVTQIQKDKRIYHIEWEMKEIKDPKGNLEFKIVQGFDISTAIQMQKKLQRLSVSRAEHEEQERKRIAEDLHDRIGVMTILTKRQINDLKQKHALPDLQLGLDKLGEEILQFMRKARHLIDDLIPPALYNIGLAAALEELADEFGTKHQAKVTFDGAYDAIKLGQEIDIFIYKTIRELLINAIKHGQADMMHISLQVENNRCSVSVDDNGIGFTNTGGQKSLAGSSGFGLFNIENRAAYYCGGLERARSELFGGGLVTIWVPGPPEE